MADEQREAQEDLSQATSPAAVTAFRAPGERALGAVEGGAAVVRGLRGRMLGHRALRHRPAKPAVSRVTSTVTCHREPGAGAAALVRSTRMGRQAWVIL